MAVIFYIFIIGLAEYLTGKSVGGLLAPLFKMVMDLISKYI